MNKNKILTTLAVVGFAVAAQATPVTFTFLENGGNVSLGNSSTFSSGGASITAYGFASSGGAATAIFAKDQGVGEQGLGIVSDPTGNNEIWGSSFVQLFANGGLPTINLSFGSTDNGEIANIYYSSTLGTIGTLIGSVTSETTFDIASIYQNGYISVSASGATDSGVPNVLLGSATVNTPPAPDGGTTIALLGAALSAAGMIRRKLVA